MRKSCGFVNLIVLLAIWVANQTHAASPVGTAFTYQGQLKQGGVPVDGTADLELTLWDALTGGNPVASPVGVDNVAVVNGLFTVELDFGATVFDGNSRWLEVAVRVPHDPADAAPFATLTPRQPLTSTPYAARALSAPNGHALDAADGDPVDAVFVDELGNVGVGTHAPTAMLHLQRAYASTGLRLQSVRFQEGPPASLVRSPASAGTSGAGQPWAAPGAARVSDDASAGVSLSGAPGGPDPSESQFLDLTNLGFTLPSQAQIVGLSVQVEGHGSCSCSDCDRCGVSLTAELTGGSDASRQQTLALGPTDQNASVGGTFDLWDLEWTAVQINSTSLGVRLRAVLGLSDIFFCLPGLGCVYQPCDCTGSGAAFVDAVSVTVYYYDVSATSTPVDWTLGVSQDDSNLRIAPTADLSSPTIIATPLGNVGIAKEPGFDSTPFGPNYYRLDVDGRIRCTNLTQTSSRRFKSNIQPIEAALDKVNRLQGVSFDWDEAHGGRHELGFVAEEVGKVAPELVTWEPDGVNAAGMQYDRVSALTVEAVKEQQRQIDALKAENADLKARLEAIEALLPKPPATPDHR